MRVAVTDCLGVIVPEISAEGKTPGTVCLSLLLYKRTFVSYIKVAHYN